MTELRKATELSILQYVASIGLNPDHVFYNRVTTNNRSISNLQWTIISPAQRLMMLDTAWIDLQFTIVKQSADGDGGNPANANWSANDKVSIKEGFPLANSITSITSIINGATITYNQPRHWMHQLCMMYAGKMGIKQCNNAGGEFWDLDGEYPTFGTQANEGNLLQSQRNPKPDKGLYNNEQKFMSRLVKNNANAVPANQNGVYVHREPVICPPWNPFGKVKTQMPDYCWFKHMSPVIGNVSRLELDIQMQNFSQALFYYRHAEHAANADRIGQLSVADITQAALTLYWYRMPDKTVVPRQLVYQTWSVREFVTTIDTGAVVNNDANTATTVQSDLIQLHSIPTLIVISAQRNRDDATAGQAYVQRSVLARDTGADQNRLSNNPSNNALDNYMEIESIEIEMGDKTGIIDTATRQEELYYITKRNSIIKDFPYDFEHWRGRKAPVLDAIAQGAQDQNSVAGASSGQVANYCSRCFLAFRPKDLGIGMSDGVQHNITFKITRANLRARSNIPSQQAAGAGFNHSYRFYVHVFYGKHTLELSSESGRYSEQRFSLDSTRSIGISGGALKIRPDDSRYVSRLSTI